MQAQHTNRVVSSAPIEHNITGVGGGGIFRNGHLCPLHKVKDENSTDSQFKTRSGYFR